MIFPFPKALGVVAMMNTGFKLNLMVILNTLAFRSFRAGRPKSLHGNHIARSLSL